METKDWSHMNCGLSSQLIGARKWCPSGHQSGSSLIVRRDGIHNVALDETDWCLAACYGGLLTCRLSNRRGLYQLRYTTMYYSLVICLQTLQLNTIIRLLF